MNIFELAIFIGLPTCIAFCVVFPLPHAFGLALAIGVASAVMAAVAVALYGLFFRLLRKRAWEGAVFPMWAFIAVVLSIASALYMRIDHSRNSPSPTQAVQRTSHPR